jgi:hypothetical protein
MKRSKTSALHMSRTEEYRRTLKTLADWKPFLLKASGLPGPLGNLELAQVVAEDATPEQVEAFLSIPPELAPENTAAVFLVFCGVTALGKRVARGESWQFARLRQYASDPRWRVREAVAIALQYAGEEDMRGLLKELRTWRKGSWLEKRAAAAALAEPRLLIDPGIAKQVLEVFDAITADIEVSANRRDEAFRVLRQSMGYCWSVAVAALPAHGKALMEKWLRSKDADVSWIMKENLRKKRLVGMDASWVKACIGRHPATPARTRKAT